MKIYSLPNKLRPHGIRQMNLALTQGPTLQPVYDPICLSLTPQEQYPALGVFEQTNKTAYVKSVLYHVWHIMALLNFIQKIKPLSLIFLEWGRVKALGNEKDRFKNFWISGERAG